MEPAETETPPVPTAACPHCRYDLGGQVATWTQSCPLEGVCPECGQSFDWREAHRKSERQRMWRRLGPAGVLGLFWTFLPAVCGVLLLANIGILSEWLEINPTLGLAGYVAVFILSAGLGFLPTYSQAILGGWVFGLALGFPAALAGFAGGSMIGYVVARTVSKDRVEKEIAAHAKWSAVRDALIGGGFWKTLGIVTLVRLPPNSPFALTNLVLSSSGTRPLPYLLGTVIGLSPRTIAAVAMAAAAAGTGAEDLQEFIAESRGSVWVIVAMVVSLVIVLGVIGKIAERALARVTNGVGRNGAGIVTAEAAAAAAMGKDAAGS